MIRLVATDLDGTFLSATGEVSQVNRLAVARAADLGCTVVVATGRPSRWLDVLDDVPGLSRQAIVSNGAATFDLDSGEHHTVFGLDPQIAVAVADDLRAAIPGVTFGFEWGHAFGREPDTMAGTDGDWLLTAPLAELASVPQPVLKLLAFHERCSSDQLSRLGRPVVGDRLTVTHSHTASYGLLEISCAGVTKATALAALCETLRVEQEEVAAFGDMPNDAAMLAWAGHGYTMPAGHPELAHFPVADSGRQDEAVGRRLLALLDATSSG